MIPKIFHFIWLGSPLPRTTRNYIASFESWNPEYEIKVWNDSNIDELLNKYDSIANDVWPRANLLCQKADILRLLALHEYGGFYIDADVECIGSFDRFLNDDVVCGLQDYAPPDERYMICNAILGATKNNSFIKLYIDALDSHLTDDRTSVGPKLLTKLAQENNIQPYFRELFYPFMWWERQNYLLHSEAVTNHYWWGN